MWTIASVNLLIFCESKWKIQNLVARIIILQASCFAVKFVFTEERSFEHTFPIPLYRFLRMIPVHGADGTATSSRASSTVTMNQKERINGWSCPWHPLQFVAWFFIFFFSVCYFGVFVFYLPEEWKAAGFIVSFGDVDF